MFAKQRMRAGFGSLAALTMLGSGACQSEQSEPMRVAKQHLTVAENRVLDFEDPTSDWSVDNASVIASTPDKAGGEAALSIVPAGYTTLSSVNIAAPGSVKTEATFQLKLTQPIPWGDARLVVTVPSQGHYWRDLGGTNLSSLSVGSFNNLSFSIPEDLRGALSSNATDVGFKLIFNTPANSGAIIVDSLVVSDEQSSAAPAYPVAFEKFAFVVPKNVPISAVTLSGSDKITIDDRSTIGASDGLTVLASGGPSRSEFGAGVNAYADIFSHGDVDFLRSQSHVSGNLTTSGTVLRQDNVVVEGTVSEAAPLRFSSTAWAVQWPEEEGSDISLPPQSPNMDVAPGNYDSVQIFSRATVSLTSGTYYINSLVVEPEAHLRVNTTAGPVIIYVKDTLRLNVGLERIAGPRGQVLFGYLGQQPALFEEAIVGSVVAPNSTIELRRPASGLPFEGSFFGKAVHVFSDATVNHLPLQWFNGSKQRCVDSIPVPPVVPGGDAQARKVAYSRMIEELCTMAGADPCEQKIAARANVDYVDIALELLIEAKTPAQYLSATRDRYRKVTATLTNPALAQAICNEDDDDLDFVPNSLDDCPETPPLTATFDDGCTDPDVPPAPDAADVSAFIQNTQLVINPLCSGATMPARSTAGAFYRSNRPDEIYSVFHRAPPQPPGCPVWYFVDVVEQFPVQRSYMVAFMDTEAVDELLENGKPVPLGYIQFKTRPSDPGTRGWLAQLSKRRTRVMMMNGGGMKSGWSDWRETTKADCLALGFQCGGTE